MIEHDRLVRERAREVDQILELRISKTRLGTTSLAVFTEFRGADDDRVIVTVETIYVVVDVKTLTKQPIPDAIRAALQAGAAGRLTDRAGYQSEN